MEEMNLLPQLEHDTVKARDGSDQGVLKVNINYYRKA